MEQNKRKGGGAFAAGVMLLLAVAPGLSQAVALYNGDLLLNLKLESITPGTAPSIVGSAALAGDNTSASPGDTATATGHATLTAADPDNLVIGDAFSFNAKVTGSSGQGAAVSSSFATEGAIILEGTGSASVVRFSYDLSYTGDATTAGLAGENATLDLLLEVIGLTETYLQFDVGVNTDLGDPALDYSENGFFDISVPADDVEEISIVVSAEGNALGLAAEVPSPSVSLLLMPGLLMLGWSRRSAR